MVLSIFKKQFPVFYQSCCDLSIEHGPDVLKRHLIDKTPGLKIHLIYILPNFLKFVKENFNYQQFGLLILETLLTTQLYPTRIEDELDQEADASIAPLMVARMTIFTKLKYLEEFVVFELFFTTSGSKSITSFIWDCYIDYMSIFNDETTSSNYPTFHDFLTFLQLRAKKKDVLILEIAQFIQAFNEFKASEECTTRLFRYKLKINAMIVNMLEIFHQISFFQLTDSVTEISTYEVPVIIFDQPILQEIQKVKQLLTIEQAWPFVMKPKDWVCNSKNRFPNFNAAGTYTNTSTSLVPLIHTNPQIRLEQTVLDQKDVLAVNTGQSFSYKLNQKLNGIFNEKHPFYDLWLMDYPYKILQDVSELKKLTKEQWVEHNSIVMSVKQEFADSKGKIPQTRYLEYRNKWHSLTTHLLTVQDRVDYDTFKRNIKATAGNKAYALTENRIRLFYQFYKNYNIWFEVFLDFRGRIYTSGFPIGTNRGVFKNFLQSPVKNTISIGKQNINNIKN